MLTLYILNVNITQVQNMWQKIKSNAHFITTKIFIEDVIVTQQYKHI